LRIQEIPVNDLIPYGNNPRLNDGAVAVVADPFGGSGSTLMACEQSERVGYTMELDPKYADVIVKRWETFTGQTATLDRARKH